MLKVVLADDENKILLLLQKLIDWKELGYEIVGTANDGLRALELVREKRPHLLITDVRMPGCSGIELIQRAKELLMDINRMTEAEAHRFLQKRSMDAGLKMVETAQMVIDSYTH